MKQSPQKQSERERKSLIMQICSDEKIVNIKMPNNKGASKTNLQPHTHTQEEGEREIKAPSKQRTNCRLNNKTPYD